MSFDEPIKKTEVPATEQVLEKVRKLASEVAAMQEAFNDLRSDLERTKKEIHGSSESFRHDDDEEWIRERRPAARQRFSDRHRHSESHHAHQVPPPFGLGSIISSLSHGLGEIGREIGQSVNEVVREVLESVEEGLREVDIDPGWWERHEPHELRISVHPGKDIRSPRGERRFSSFIDEKSEWFTRLRTDTHLRIILEKLGKESITESEIGQLLGSQDESETKEVLSFLLTKGLAIQEGMGKRRLLITLKGKRTLEKLT